MKNKFVIVRTYSAGCFAGFLVSRNGMEVNLKSARRLWYWAGAASLSQLAAEGTKKPSECKFAIPVNVLLTQAIEIIEVTQAAQDSILSVPTWIV